jgi:two-component system invasion response regulator UvrY
MKSRVKASLAVGERDRLASDTLRMAWEAREGGTWAGAAGSVAECMRICRRRRPSLMLISSDLPGGSAWDLAHWVGTHLPERRVAVLITELTELEAVRAGRVQPAGLLLRAETSVSSLVTALRAIGLGKRIRSPAVAAALARVARDGRAWHRLLSQREQHLLEWFALARDDATIGRSLELSVHSVRTFRQRILSRLGLHSTIELIRWARDRGFGRHSQTCLIRQR